MPKELKFQQLGGHKHTRWLLMSSPGCRLEISRMKPGKCAGSGGFTAGAMHAWSDDTLRLLAAFFVELIQNRVSPWLEAWRSVRCVRVLIPKLQSWGKIKDLRPIMLLPVTPKLYSRVLLYVLRPWISPREEWPLGIHAHDQPAELIRCVLGILEKAVEWSEEVHVVKTYGRVSLPLLQMYLQSSGTPVQLIKSLLRSNTEKKVSPIAPGVVCQEHLWVGKGRPQGDLASHGSSRCWNMSCARC